MTIELETRGRRRRRFFPLFFSPWMLLLAVAAGASGQEPPAPPPPPAAAMEAPPTDRAAPGSAEALRAATSDPRFLPEPVRELPDGGEVPSPAAFLHRLPGGAGGMATAAELADYLRALDGASDRVSLVAIGKSDEGREILLARIAEPEVLADLERFQQIGARLADPRATPAADVPGLAAAGKVFYLLWSGARASDVAAPEALAELAYRLAVSERPEIRAIRQNAVVLLAPVLDPDARDRAVAWYDKNLRGRKLPEAALSPLDGLGAPPVAGAYAADDGDKDGLRLALAASRALQGAFFTYLPQVVHELADGGEPFVTLAGAPAGADSWLSPQAAEEMGTLAAAESARLAEWGTPGVSVSGTWDAWWPGRLGAVAALHNALTRRTAVFATPVLDPLTVRPGGGDPLAWTGRNTVNLEETAALAALEVAAGHREELLAHLWARSQAALDAGRTGPPHAGLVAPEALADPARRAAFLDGLAAQRIEGGYLAADFDLSGRSLKAGTLVIRLDQPYGRAALALLGEARFPGGGAPAAAAWAWPALFGVPIEPVADPRILEAPLAFGAERPAGKVGGTGDEIFLLRDAGQLALPTARVLLGSHQVDAAEAKFEAGGAAYPAGSWIVLAPRAAVEEVAAKTGLSFEAALNLPEVARHIVDLPRLGLYAPWADTRGAGWVRLGLDGAGLPYTMVTDGDLKAGGLNERFDVLLLPDARGSLLRQLHGLDPRWGAFAFAGGGGLPVAPDVTGGFGAEGLAAVARFVRDGGVLLTLGNAAHIPAAAGLLRGWELPSPAARPLLGSELGAAILRPGPLTYGYGAQVSLFAQGGPWLEPAAPEPAQVVIRFGPPSASREARPRPAPSEPKREGIPDVEPPAAGHPGLFEVEDLEASETPAATATTLQAEPFRPVVTGAASDGEAAAGRPALLDVPVGKGRVVAFAFDPFARALPLSDQRLVYNAILHWNDLGK